MKRLFLRSILCSFLCLTALMSSCRRDGVDPKNAKGGSGGSGTSTSQTQLDHLIIQEVYYYGNYVNTKPEGEGEKIYPIEYEDDQYIKLYNPTSQTVYLDNYALAIHKFSPSNRIELATEFNFIPTHFGAASVIRFGGNGTEHPLKPGASVVIAKKAINHAKAKEAEILADDEEVDQYQRVDKLLDLSQATYQWIPKKGDDDDAITSKAQEMKYWYYQDNQTASWDTTEEEFKLYSQCAIALIKLGESPDQIKATYLAEQAYTNASDIAKRKYYKAVSYNVSGHHSHAEFVLTFPNSWVEDVVTICPNTEYKWGLVVPQLDKGHKGVQETAKNDDASRMKNAGKAITRKFDGKKFVDDNNSTSDFEIVEAQPFTKK